MLAARLRTGRAEPERTWVTAELTDGTQLCSRYLAGCDGGRSRCASCSASAFPASPPGSCGPLCEVGGGRAGGDAGRGGGLEATGEVFARTDFDAHSARWLSRFDDVTRPAERYRTGRMLLAAKALVAAATDSRSSAPRLRLLC